MRVLELFAGYGSQALALENLGIEFTSDISEIDKYAIQAYNQLHGDTHNWGDITKIDETKLPYYDLITYSSPCQDFSVAGLQRGGDKDSGTHSSLLWECERIIRAVKPKYLLMENVKNLVGEKHKHNFIKWLKVLESIGYKNWWKVLNAKDYGVPQNRERVFVVSILGGTEYLFPNPIKLEKRLKDVLEPVVDEKYYLKCDSLIEKLKDKQYLNTIRCGGGSITDTKHSWDIVCVGGMQEHQSITTDGTSTCLTSSMGQGGGYVPMIINNEPNVLTPKRTEYGKQIRKDYESGTVKESRHNMTELEPRQDGISNTLTSVQNDNMLLEPKVQQVGNIVETDSFGGNPQCGRVYSDDGISPTLNTMQGGGREPKILQKGIGNNPNKFEFNGFHNVSLALMASDSKNIKCYSDGYRIRKLTPRECWRLMGVKDEQFDKLFDIQKLYLQGDNECNAKFVDAKERQKQSDLDTSAFCIIKDILNMETLKQTKTKNALETEQIKNVKFVIEKLAKVEHWDTVINITKCLENGEMLYTLIKELGQHRVAIIELEKEDKENTGKYMKISLEENYYLPKLYIILTLIALITKLKIYTFMKAKANIQGNIAIIENSSKSISLKILSLEMEFTTQKLSSTQLYKLAGNSIVVDVLMGIFKNLLISDEGTKGQLTLL